MEGSVQEKITNTLKQKYEDEILHIETPYDFLSITVKKEKIAEIIRYLYENPDTRFQYLTSIGAVHYPELNQIAIVYQLHNLISNERLRLKIYLPSDNAVTESITSIFLGANWMERE